MNAFLEKSENNWKISCLYLHLNSQIFAINSNADADGIPVNDSNANTAFVKLLNSDSDYDSARVQMHSITNADSNSDSPSLPFGPKFKAKTGTEMTNSGQKIAI